MGLLFEPFFENGQPLSGLLLTTFKFSQDLFGFRRTRPHSFPIAVAIRGLKRIVFTF